MEVDIQLAPLGLRAYCDWNLIDTRTSRSGHGAMISSPTRGEDASRRIAMPYGKQKFVVTHNLNGFRGPSA